MERAYRVSSELKSPVDAGSHLKSPVDAGSHVCGMLEAVSYEEPYRHLQELGQVRDRCVCLLKLNILFFGYVDPVIIIFYNENN